MFSKIHSGRWGKLTFSVSAYYRGFMTMSYQIISQGLARYGWRMAVFWKMEKILLWWPWLRLKLLLIIKVFRNKWIFGFKDPSEMINVSSVSVPVYTWSAVYLFRLFWLLTEHNPLTLLVLWHLWVPWKISIPPRASAPSSAASHWLMSRLEAETSITNRPTKLLKKKSLSERNDRNNLRSFCFC